MPTNSPQLSSWCTRHPAASPRASRPPAPRHALQHLGRLADEAVADADDGLDVVVEPKLLAHPADVDVEGACIGRVARSPYSSEQVLARDHPPPRLGEQSQDRKLLAREPYLFA